MPAIQHISVTERSLKVAFQQKLKCGFFLVKHPSVRKNPIVVCRKLNKELHLNRISGPYSFKTFDKSICSPLGFVPKKTPGEYRIIDDLSFPEGKSVNEHIPRENATIQYKSIENVIQFIKKFGLGAITA